MIRKICSYWEGGSQLNISSDHRRWGFAFFPSVVRNNRKKQRALVCLSSSQLHFSALPMVPWVRGWGFLSMSLPWWAGHREKENRREVTSVLRSFPGHVWADPLHLQYYSKMSISQRHPSDNKYHLPRWLPLLLISDQNGLSLSNRYNKHRKTWPIKNRNLVKINLRSTVLFSFIHCFLSSL